jgi:hypothetical protein
MFEKIVMKLILAACMVVGTVAWAAAPSIDQVYQAAKAGNYTQAQTMMDQVLREYPNSAKAHFVEAELLTKQGKLAAARHEFDTAQKLDPSLSFAKPEALQELKSRLAGGSAPVRPIGDGQAQAGSMQIPPTAGGQAQAGSVPVQPANGGQAQAGSVQVRPTNGEHRSWWPINGDEISWWSIMAVVVVVAVAMMFVRPRNRDTGGYRPDMPMPGNPAGPTGYGPAGPMGYGPAGPMGYGPGGVPPQMGGGMGPGILGGLATGAAMGAGMIAGEGLMRRMLDQGAHGPTVLPHGVPIPSSDGSGGYDGGGGYDMGGNDFGVTDPGSWDSGGGGDSGGGDDGGGWT